MKITILKDKLKEGVGIVEKISQKIMALPILQNTLLRVEKNFLNLSVTNLESGISWWGLVKTERDGQLCVPTKFFSTLINYLPNKPINLEDKDLILNLECENYKTKIKGFNSEEFPIIPQIKKDESITINNLSFCQALNQLINIPSSSITKPEISGILFSFQDDSLKLVATDSFRLAEKKLFLKNNTSKNYSFILPQSSAKEIIGIFSEGEGEMTIYFSPNQIWFERLMPEINHPQIQFTSRLIEGEYPNYQEIIPKKFETRIEVQRDEFLNQIKMAGLFGGKINEVRLKINPKNETIEISNQNPDLGECNSVLNSKVKGKDLSISFNSRFLIEGIAEIKTKDLVFELTSGEGPAVLKPADGQDYLYIIMPIKAS